MTSSLRLVAGSLALAFAVAASAAERAHDFANVLPLVLPSADAVYRFDMPAAVYEGVVRPDLGDVRFFNANGEPVPYALLPRATTLPAKAERRALALFPLKAEEGARIEGLDLRVEQSGGRTRISVATGAGGGAGTTSRAARVVGYIADAGENPPAIHALVLEGLPRDALARLRIEGSDDLRNWRTVVTDAPIANLRSGDAALVQDRIALPSTRLRYYRIATSIAISGLAAESGDTSVEVPREWKRVAPAASRPGEGEYEFDVGGRFPVDRMRIELPEANTVASVTLLSRARANDPWRPVTTGVIYRMNRDGIDLKSADLRVGNASDRLWLLRVDKRGGGLGSGAPALAIGWVPDRAVFVARGTPPFAIGFGNYHAEPAAFPIERMLPDYRPGQPVAAPLARLETPADRAASDQAAKTVVVKQPERPVDYKTWTLYAVLVAGLVVLAALAIGLARKMNRPG